MHTYHYVSVRLMPASFVELLLCPLDALFGRGVGVTLIPLKAITLAPPFRWVDAISYFFSQTSGIIDLIEILYNNISVRIIPSTQSFSAAAVIVIVVVAVAAAFVVAVAVAVAVEKRRRKNL